MTFAYVQQHWALLGASVLGLAVLLFAGWRAWLDSSAGRLRAARRRLVEKRREVRVLGDGPNLNIRRKDADA